MRRRLVGLETEYAFRISPVSDRPDHRDIYEAILRSLKKKTGVVEGSGSLKWEQVFTQNGSGISYEAVPSHLDGGFLEGATPECDRPALAALYQLALDRLLANCLVDIESNRQIGLIKNCRDAPGHIYGAQENYEAEFVPPGEGGLLKWLFWFAAGMLLFVAIPYLICIQFFSLLVFVLFASVYILHAFFLLLLIPFCSRLSEETQRDRMSRRLERITGRIVVAIDVALTAPIALPFLFLVKSIGFRKQRRAILAFLVSRIIITGSGSLNRDGVFELSEKASSVRRLVRSTNLPADRAIFDTGNLYKNFIMIPLSMFQARLTPFRKLFATTQRMQIGLSDSCMGHIPLFLKTMLTTLMLDMAEAGYLDDAPRLKSPVKALHILNRDVQLKATVETNAGAMTALQIQRWYADRARLYLKDFPDVEMVRAVKLWEELLKDLGEDRYRCFGRLDWVTKELLLEHSSDFEAKKTIDLYYHELGSGYHEKLRGEGLMVDLFTEEEIARAMNEPPDSIRGNAVIRSEIIKRSSLFDEGVQVSWDHVRIGRGLRSRVLSLDEFRKKRQS
jgi:proteasome accessory factor A